MNRSAYIPSSRRRSGRSRSSFVIRHSSLSRRPIFLRRDDSQSLSSDYSEIARLERHRALCLRLAIVSLLIAAACIYLATS